jgi:Domain of unknown function (DUF6285)
MQDRPNVDELLEAVAGFLQDDVMPNTTGRLNFHARVASNVLQMLRRELALEEPALRREWDGLDSVLGRAPVPPTLAEWRAASIWRNEELANRIRVGEADDLASHAAVVAHLRSVMRDKLAVSNPGLLADS